MRKDLINTHASKRSANLGPGSTFESVGVFFMNITKPKPIPADICNRCLEELENQIIQLEVKKQNCTNKVFIPVYKYEMHKLGLQQRYYIECAKLYARRLNDDKRIY